VLGEASGRCRKKGQGGVVEGAHHAIAKVLGVEGCRPTGRVVAGRRLTLEQEYLAMGSQFIGGGGARNAGADHQEIDGHAAIRWSRAMPASVSPRWTRPWP